MTKSEEEKHIRETAKDYAVECIDDLLHNRNERVLLRRAEVTVGPSYYCHMSIPRVCCCEGEKMVVNGQDYLSCRFHKMESKIGDYVFNVHGTIKNFNELYLRHIR